jgi:hypothetical protein
MIEKKINLSESNMNKAMYTICGPILTSFFFEITINPKRLPNRPSMINAGARYVAEKLFK